MSKDHYNVAVIGAGAIGLDHIRSFQKHPAASVVALAEVSPERGKEAADEFGIATLVTDYKTLLARDDIDVVSIALPNYLHAPVGLDALKAGKNVMIDKPIATRAEDAAQLLEEVKKQGTLLMVGQNQRTTETVQTAKQMINAGKLGEVYHAKTAMLRRSGIPRIGSWFTQTEFAGGRRDLRHRRSRPGSRALFDGRVRGAFGERQDLRRVRAARIGRRQLGQRRDRSQQTLRCG